MFARLKRLFKRPRPASEREDQRRGWRENMDRSQEALLVVRPPRHVLYANAVAASLLGQRSDELVNSTFAWPLALGELSNITLSHGHDHSVTLEAGAAAIRWDNAPAWLVTLRDITGPKSPQSLKNERVKMLERMVHGAALTDILTALIQFVESQYPSSICTVMLLDPDGLRLRYGASTRLPRQMIDIVDQTRVGPCHGSCGSAALERQAVIVSDIATDPRWADTPRGVALESGIHACWSIPVFSTAGAVIGTFATYYNAPREPSTDEIELVSDFTQLVAVAIEHHRAEAQLKLLESSIAHVNDMVIITDALSIDEPGPRIVFVNEAVVRQTGYTRDDLLGKPPRIFHGELTQRDELDRIRRALATRQPVRAELIHYARDGRLFWVEVDITAIHDAEGHATHFVSVQRDITQFKRIEEAMRLSEERFRLLARVTTDAIWDWNLETNELWWSDGIETLFGHRVAQLEPNIESWTNRLHPDDRNRVVDGVHALIDSGGKNWRGEYRFRRGDGSFAHVVDHGAVSHNDNGKPIRMVGGINDVTERHDAEVGARRTAQTQSLIMRAQREIAEAGLDVTAVMQLIAQRAQELAGAEGAAVVMAEEGALVYRAVSGSAHAHLGLRLNIEHSIAGAAIRLREAQICHDAENDPRTDPVAFPMVLARSVMCVPLHRKELWGAILSVIARRPNAFDACDLTNLQILADSLGSALQRAQDAEQLQQSEAKYRQLFDRNPQPMVVYELESRKFLTVNVAAMAHYGYSLDEFLGMEVFDLHPAEQLPLLKAHLDPPLRGPRRADRWRHRVKGGALIDVELSSDDIVFEGRAARLVLITDVTKMIASKSAKKTE